VKEQANANIHRVLFTSESRQPANEAFLNPRTRATVSANPVPITKFKIVALDDQDDEITTIPWEYMVQRRKTESNKSELLLIIEDVEVCDDKFQMETGVWAWATAAQHDGRHIRSPMALDLYVREQAKAGIACIYIKSENRRPANRVLPNTTAHAAVEPVIKRTGRLSMTPSQQIIESIEPQLEANSKLSQNTNSTDTTMPSDDIKPTTPGETAEDTVPEAENLHNGRAHSQDDMVRSHNEPENGRDASVHPETAKSPPELHTREDIQVAQDKEQVVPPPVSESTHLAKPDISHPSNAPSATTSTKHHNSKRSHPTTPHESNNSVLDVSNHIYQPQAEKGTKRAKSPSSVVLDSSPIKRRRLINRKRHNSKTRARRRSASPTDRSDSSGIESEYSEFQPSASQHSADEDDPMEGIERGEEDSHNAPVKKIADAISISDDNAEEDNAEVRAKYVSINNPYIQQFQITDSGSKIALEDIDSEERALRNQQKLLKKLMHKRAKDTKLAKELAYVTIAAIDQILLLFPLLNRDDLMKSGRIPLPNFGLRKDMTLQPYQIKFIALSFLREQGLDITGGVLGDDPGAGKTVQLLAQALTSFYHAINVKEVLEDRTKGDARRHLPHAHQDGAKCPSASTQPIRCCCEDTEQHHVYSYPPTPQTGCTVIFTPTAGVRSFATDIQRMTEGADIMRLPVAPRFAIVTPTYRDEDGIGQLTESELQEAGVRAEWNMQYESDTALMISGVVREGTWSKPTYHRIGDSYPKNHYATSKDATEKLPSATAARFIIITNRQNAGVWIADRFNLMLSSTWTADNKKSNRSHSETIDTIHVGRLLWDECHLETSAGTNLMTFAEKWRSLHFKRCRRPLPVWGASGTPEGSNPFHLIAWIARCLRNPRWANHPSNAVRTLDADTASKTAKVVQALFDKAKRKPKDALRDPRLPEW
jgi:hypothetical protein